MTNRFSTQKHASSKRCQSVGALCCGDGIGRGRAGRTFGARTSAGTGSLGLFLGLLAPQQGAVLCGGTSSQRTQGGVYMGLDRTGTFSGTFSGTFVGTFAGTFAGTFVGTFAGTF